MEYYSIMGLDTNNVDEICQDIKEQVESGVASCALFCMTLVPEGNPPVNKAEVLAGKYMLFKKKLDEMGLKSGILVQASIGHGYPLSEMFPYTRYVNLSDGEEQNVCCPYDDGFCDYIKNVMVTLAKTEPDVIMVDDDFRLMFRGGLGCACELHMAEFNRIAGTDITRAELMEFFKNKGDKEREFTDLFVKTQHESLIKAAKAMREGIDSVNPDLPGIFCGCGANMEAAADIAKILAGKNNPVIVRINNGSYLSTSGRGFTKVFYRAALQMQNIGDGVDIFLDETDTCPQNRYSTSATSVHTHHVGTILEGVRGAKHWITRLTCHEPNSGKAYRKMLGKYNGMYKTLADMVPELKWRGCRIPLAKKPYYDFSSPIWYTDREAWSSCVLERFGLPFYYSSEKSDVVFMENDSDKKYSDAEILEFLSGNFFVASDTAKRLIKRGFGKYLGVDVREWKGVRASSELLFVNQKRCNAQKDVMELVPLNDKVKIESEVCYTVDTENYTTLFPGVTSFKNELGGRVVVFSGSPFAENGYVEPFAMLNESRKHQFIDLLSETDALPIYYPDDNEVYLRVADMKDGKRFVAVFNLGVDIMDEIPLISDCEIKAVKTMNPNGTLSECGVHKDGNTYVIEKNVYSFMPEIFIIE